MKAAYEVTARCFDAFSVIASRPESVQNNRELVRRQLMDDIDAMVANASGSMSAETINDIQLALVAMADEVVYRALGEGQGQHWMGQSLQLHYFQTVKARAEFYDRLNRHIDDPSWVDALQIYALCLLFGFGLLHASAAEEEERSALLQRVMDRLAARGGERALAPNLETTRESRRSISTWKWLLWCAVFVSLFGLGITVGLRRALEGNADNLLPCIEGLSQEAIQ